MMRNQLPLAKFFQRTVLLLVIAALAGCAGIFGPRNVDIPLQRLQASLERKFPIKQRPLALIDIELTHPVLALQAASNRVTTTMDATVAPVFTSRVWRGTFTLSGVLQLDSARQAVMLVQPQIDRVAIDGVDPAIATQVANAAGMLAGQIFRDTPLYTFKPEDFHFGGSNFLPTKLAVTSTGLVVTFTPTK